MHYVLYYPSIEFQSIDILKKSLLIWDRVFRIVPSDYVPKDAAEIHEAVATGAIVNLTLDDDEKSQAAKKFLQFYADRNSQSNRLVWPAGMDSENLTRLNPDKIDAKLLPLFEQLSRRLSHDGFLEISQELAGGYMFYLAKAVAQKRSLGLFTDSADCWTVGTYFANDGNFDDWVYKEKADAYLCNLAIDDLLPDELEHVRMDKLLRFVEKHRGERTELQNELKGLREAISTCNNKTHARYIVEDFIKKFEKAKNEYRSAVSPLAKRELCSIFSVGLPATMGFLSLPVVGGGDPYTVLKLGVGTLFGAISALATRELISKESTVASYLVSAEYLTRTPHGPLHRKFEEFIND